MPTTSPTATAPSRTAGLGWWALWPGLAAMALLGSSVAVIDATRTLPVFALQSARYAVDVAAIVVFARIFQVRLVLPRFRDLGWVLGGAATGLVGFNLATIVGTAHAEPAFLGAAVGCIPLVLALAAGRRPSPRLVVSAVVVYALVRLADTVTRLQEASRDLARGAAVQQRLRTARDLHDLLGHTLAAILLKGELALRLPPERARAELTELIAMAERARAELGAAPPLTLDEELGQARRILASAGISTTVQAGHGVLKPGLDAVFGVVLREAVTNILRHSDATACTITTDDHGLRVENDGRRAAPPHAPGSGLANLTGRLAELGGTLTATSEADRFLLHAAVAPA